MVGQLSGRIKSNTRIHTCAPYACTRTRTFQMLFERCAAAFGRNGNSHKSTLDDAEGQVSVLFPAPQDGVPTPPVLCQVHRHDSLPTLTPDRQCQFPSVINLPGQTSAAAARGSFLPEIDVFLLSKLVYSNAISA